MTKQRAAVLRLLGDDDPVTIELVKTQLTQAGVAALPELRELLAAADRVAARPLRQMIAGLERDFADDLFGELCARFTEADLEDAIWRLAATFLPGENFDEQREQLDAWAAEVSRR